MPIDLKWVRSDPDQVRQWQTCRQLDDDLVDEVLRKDELSRQNLQIIQEHKKELKDVQLRLRPKKNTSEQPQESRGNLLNQKKSVEAKIKSAEADWKASKEDMHKTLCQLASPVNIPGDDAYDLEASQVTVMPVSLPFGRSRSFLGMNLEHAWRQYTLRYFEDYLWVELPRGMTVMEPLSSSSLSDVACLTRTRAEELWGYCGMPDAATNSLVLLPSWIRLLTEFLPNKSIWGEKELPRYSAIWSRGDGMNRDDAVWVGGPKDADSIQHNLSSLELVAVMAPSVVDAREIQNKLVKELLGYYGSLLVDSSQLKRIVVPAPDLHTHERSRIEIHVQLRHAEQIQTIRLGYVSHWGDAGTRACDMAFSGGGVVGKKNRNVSKEYVHLVEASVFDDSTWTKLLFVNSNVETDENQMVNIPSELIPHLIRPISDSTRVPLKDLFLDEKSKRKKKESVFGVVGKKIDTSRVQKLQQEAAIETTGVDKRFATKAPKFPPLGVPSSQAELANRTRMEKLSCPYDFLFDQAGLHH